MKFTFSGGNKNAVFTVENEYEKDGIYFADLKMVLDEEAVPSQFTIFWKLPMIDCYSTWSPCVRQGRNIGPNWRPNATDSRLAVFMPLHSIVSLSGRNRMTVSLSDAFNPIKIFTGVCEEDACIDCKIHFFTVPVAPIKEYVCRIRIDLRDIPYYDSIYENVEWWENECGYVPAHVPEHARLPMNSLWYSYHQELDVDDIIEECKLSKPLGMETVIVDDGWQTENNERGYAYCGDWKTAPSKIPNMEAFIDGIHSVGMKVMFWFSVPYIGIHSENYEKFKDMLLDQTGNNKDHWCLDPRYKKVRDFLTETYVNAVTNWNLDGLKLDFIDSFALRGKSLEYDERRDYTALEDAIDALMTDISAQLRKINPDILIEFRQAYVGPAIRKYGNMLRVTDCPNDAYMNRNDVINLRLTSGKTAVHSDMLMWNGDDTVESAALQIASVMYSVPQISVKIATLSEEHRKMLSYYLRLWRENRELLLDGKIIASYPESNYGTAASVKDGRAFYTCFGENVIDDELGTDVIVINATRRSSLIFKGFTGNKYTVNDCMGNVLESGEVSEKLYEINVPLCGVVTFTK